MEEYNLCRLHRFHQIRVSVDLQGCQTHRHF
jgi:hypothetical protein